MKRKIGVQLAMTLESQVSYERVVKRWCTFYQVPSQYVKREYNSMKMIWTLYITPTQHF